MDKYRELKSIGCSRGSAKLVENIRDGKKYVVKDAKFQHGRQGDRDRAQRECDILIRLRHPNIIKYIESITVCGRQYLVMQWAEGGSLEEAIVERRRSKAGPFTDQVVLSWFAQLCRALHHCHEHKVLHRNIKASTCFLTLDKHGLLLGDFGIAKVLDCTAAVETTTLGSPQEMAPEWIEGKPYTPASDVWSLGCLLFEMCSLRHPFESSNFRELWEKVSGPPPELPSTAGPVARRLVVSLLRKNPADRVRLTALLQVPELQVASAPPPSAAGIPSQLMEGDTEDTEEWAALTRARLSGIVAYLDGLRAADSEHLSQQLALRKPPTPEMPADRLRRADARQRSQTPAEEKVGLRPRPAPKAAPKPAAPQPKPPHGRRRPGSAAAPAQQQPSAKEVLQMREAELEVKRRRLREEREGKREKEKQQEAAREGERRANAEERKRAMEQRRAGGAAALAPRAGQLGRQAGVSAPAPTRLAQEQADLAAKRDRILREKEEKRRDKAEQEARLEVERRANAQARREAAQVRKEKFRVAGDDDQRPTSPPRRGDIAFSSPCLDKTASSAASPVRDRTPERAPRSPVLRSPQHGSGRSGGGYSGGFAAAPRRRAPEGGFAQQPSAERKQQREAAQQELREQIAAHRRAAARSRTPADGPSIEMCLQNFAK